MLPCCVTAYNTCKGSEDVAWLLRCLSDPWYHLQSQHWEKRLEGGGQLTETFSYPKNSRPAWITWYAVSKESGKERTEEQKKGWKEGHKQASYLVPSWQVRLPHQARPTFSDHTSKNILSHPSIQTDSKCTHLPRQRPIISSSSQGIHRGGI